MEVIDAFRATGALLDGHFLLHSGRHSRQYFQCALLLQHAKLASELIGKLTIQVRNLGFDTVISQAMGGVLVGQELARQLETRHIYIEKDANGHPRLRRFAIKPGERFIIAEDVVTTGASVHETIEIIKAAGGIPVAVAVIVDRSVQPGVDFGVPLYSLLKSHVDTYEANQLPADLAATPVSKPTST